jgi:hypothetical protein
MIVMVRPPSSSLASGGSLSRHLARAFSQNIWAVTDICLVALLNKDPATFAVASAEAVSISRLKYLTSVGLQMAQY